MTEHGERYKPRDLTPLTDAHAHLDEYVEQHRRESGEYPIVVEEAEVDEYDADRPNLLYQVGDVVFAHIYGDHGTPTTYNTVEPKLEPGEQELAETVKNRILMESAKHDAPIEREREAVKGYIDTLLDEVVIEPGTTGFVPEVKERLDLGVRLEPGERERIRYQLHREIAGLGRLEPMLMDSNNEDIHIIGPSESFVDHGTFGLLKTDIAFDSDAELDTFLRNLGERMNTPMSDSQPIVDTTLPDGSRINIVYSNDVSLRGPSLTIRQGDEVPLSIFQITKWGTLSPMMAAYLWLCLENERTVFVVGETASGKTTTLNAMLTFIPNDSKILTAEDTPEVLPPQNAWQQLVTRESPRDDANDVKLFNLVEGALRSRPDYIVVGEVRGEEAQMAFQAIQTGHPVILTFHAPNIKSMIQRFTGEPINVPETFIDNADVALFQNRVKTDDGDILRRVTGVSEIIGYSDEQEGVISKEVFSWDPADDEHEFLGMNNSFVLEEQVAELLGYEDRTAIYDELERRATIIERMIEAGYTGYEETNGMVDTIQNDGVESLPINTVGLSKEPQRRRR